MITMCHHVYQSIGTAPRHLPEDPKKRNFDVKVIRVHIMPQTNFCNPILDTPKILKYSVLWNGTSFVDQNAFLSSVVDFGVKIYQSHWLGYESPSSKRLLSFYQVITHIQFIFTNAFFSCQLETYTAENSTNKTSPYNKDEDTYNKESWDATDDSHSPSDLAQDLNHFSEEFLTPNKATNGFEDFGLSIKSLKSQTRQCSSLFNPETQATVNTRKMYFENCRNQLNTFETQPICLCGSLCWLNGVCCADYFSLILKRNAFDSEDELLRAEVQISEIRSSFRGFRSFYDLISTLRLATCEPIWPDFRRRFYLIRKCSQELDVKTRFHSLYRQLKKSPSKTSKIFIGLSKDEITDYCEKKNNNMDPYHNIPIISGPFNGIDYYNIFCAVCNAVEMMVMWSTKLISNDGNNVKKTLIIQSQHDFEKLLNNYTIRLQEPHPSSECFLDASSSSAPRSNKKQSFAARKSQATDRQNSTVDELLCTRYRLLIKENDTFYDNPHCYEIENDLVSDISFDFILKTTNSSSVCYTHQKEKQESDLFLGESILFRTQDAEDVHVYYIRNKTCPESAAYVPFYEECVTAKCPHNTVFVDGRCQDVLVSSEFVVEVNSSKFKPENIERTSMKNLRSEITITYILLNTLNSKRYLLATFNSSAKVSQTIKLSRDSKQYEFLLEWFELMKPKSLSILIKRYQSLIKDFIFLYSQQLRQIKEVAVYAYVDPNFAAFGTKPCYSQVLNLIVDDTRTRLALLCEELQMSKFITINSSTVINPCAVILKNSTKKKNFVYDTCFTMTAELPSYNFFDDLVFKGLKENFMDQISAEQNSFLILHKSISSFMYGKVPLNIESFRMSQENEKARISQNNEKARISQNNEMSRMSQNNEMSRISQNNEMSRISQSNEMSRISQNNEMSRISQSNEMSRISQNNEMSRISQNNEMSRISQSNEMSRISQNNEMSRISQINEMSRISQINEMSRMSQNNEMSRISQSNEMSRMSHWTEETNTVDNKLAAFNPRDLQTLVCSVDFKLEQIETDIFAGDTKRKIYKEGTGSLLVPNDNYWIEYSMRRHNNSYRHTLTYSWCELLPLHDRCSVNHLLNISQSRTVHLQNWLIVTASFATAEAFWEFANSSHDAVTFNNKTAYEGVITKFCYQYGVDVDVYLEGDYIKTDDGLTVCTSLRHSYPLRNSEVGSAFRNFYLISLCLLFTS
ncbi:hypothetical protein BgiBS90_033236 [Biomphalaria glabrata]|nr:hypothetical protein BgiBS90_033236 [Biomphalaria glabrata]